MMPELGRSVVHVEGGAAARVDRGHAPYDCGG